jgi:bifunctional non-homologous end joining protein LigD
MTEIKPMLLSEKAFEQVNFEDYKDYYSQIKYNGVFAILHIKNGKITSIRNRSNHPTLYLYPELEKVDLGIKEGILIAEIVVMKNGKSVFYGGIDQRRSRKEDKENAVSVAIHDALKMNDTILVNKPYKERYDALISGFDKYFQVASKPADITTGDSAFIVENYNAAELWQKVLKENEEGIVIKNTNAPYEMGVRSEKYIKVKNYKNCEVAVAELEENNKGQKAYGKATIDGKEIDVEVQYHKGGLAIGDKIAVKYLDCVKTDKGFRLIQPTKF